MRLKTNTILDRIKCHNWLVVYLCLCAVVITVCFGALVVRGQAYVYLDIGADTYSSYWPYYVFFRDSISTGFSFWSFSLGLGGSVFSFISLLFDPFNSILFIFPYDNFHHGLMVTSVAKYLVLCALAWLYLKELAFKGAPLVIGSLCFVFCGFFVGWGQHYHFATMFVLFTLVLYCFERWLNKSTWPPLLLSVALLAFHSFYFTYMAFVFLIVYVVFRYFIRKPGKSFKTYALSLFSIAIGGISLAAISILPQIVELTGSERVGSMVLPQLRLPHRRELLTLAARFISNNILGVNEFQGTLNYYEAPFLFTGILLIVLLPVLLAKSVRNRTIIISCALILLSLVFSTVSGPVFNAFSTNTLRWTFVLVPVLCIGVAYAAKAVIANNSLNANAMTGAVCGLSITVAVWFLTKPSSTNTEFVIYATCLLFLTYYGLFFFRDKIRTKWFKVVLATLVCIEVAFNAYASINYRSTMPLDGSFPIAHFDSTAEGLALLPEDERFYRVAKNYGAIDLTDPLVRGYFGEKLYSSVIPGRMWDFMENYQLRWPGTNYFFGFEQNEPLRGWFSGRYLLSRGENIRYGYEYLDRQGDISVYESSLFIPLGVLYDKVLPLEELESLNSLERTAAILTAAAVSVEDAGVIPVVTAQEASDGLILENRSALLLVGDDLSHENLIVAEELIALSYIGVLNPRILAIPEFTVSYPIVISFEVPMWQRGTGTIYYRTENMGYVPYESVSFYISGQKTHYFIPLSVLDITGLYIDIPEHVELSDLALWEWNIDAMRADIGKLRDSAMVISTFSQNYITGTVSAAVDSILCFSIPYSTAWEVLIDGVKTEIFAVNEAFLGINIPAGEHSMALRYRQPGLRVGGIISAVLFIMLIVFSVYRRRKRKLECSVL